MAGKKRPKSLAQTEKKGPANPSGQRRPHAASRPGPRRIHLLLQGYVAVEASEDDAEVLMPAERSRGTTKPLFEIGGLAEKHGSVEVSVNPAQSRVVFGLKDSASRLRLQLRGSSGLNRGRVGNSPSQAVGGGDANYFRTESTGKVA